MADQQIGNVVGFATKSVNGGTNPTNINGGGNNAPQASLLDADLNFQSITKMRARLAAINGGLYTAAYLNTMTFNDMVYAIRLNDYAGSI